MKNSLIKVSASLILIFSVLIVGCNKQSKDPKFLASTIWVSSIAQLAGIDDVECIAPADLKHPPEYEITPQDILRVAKADMFFYAGYERMMKTISEATEVDKSKIAKVKTTNTLENLQKMVIMLSEKAGTQELARKRFYEYEKLIAETRQKIIDTGLNKKTVFAHKDQVQLARDLGLNVVEVFGSAPLTAGQIALANKNQFDIIIDNVHNPVAGPAVAVCPNAVLLVWRNFPTKAEKDALYNVVKANCQSLFVN